MKGYCILQSEELLAAFLDGNVSASETAQVLEAMANDKELQELMSVSMAVDEELGVLDCKGDVLPFTAMAAQCNDKNLCCIECEKFVLQQMCISFEEEDILSAAKENNWLQENGTPLHNVGRILERAGLAVVRRYNAAYEDIQSYLQKGASVLVAVDAYELAMYDNGIEDMLFGETPNHIVAVVAYDSQTNLVTLFNPDNSPNIHTLPLNQFLDAWKDSDNYLVAAAPCGVLEYEPVPLDLSGIELEDDLDELREAIAENAHEVWALGRKKEGWSYGPKRDDQLKQTPDMVPYSQLPDSEKQYDRDMAINTIKLLKKLGYELVRKDRHDK